MLVGHGVLTIETGFRCNNRCDHCPQAAVRRLGRILHEPSTDELLRRVRDGRAAGFESIAFTGGDPTIRKDLPDLVRAARAAGYAHVALSTNGRVLAYRDYVTTLLDAGVDGLSVSLHGPDAAIHDGLTGVPGSFAQCVRGLETLRRTVRETGRFVAVNTVTVLAPETLPHLRRTLELAGALGVPLHILQPFILSREVLPCAGRFLMPLDAIEAGVREACRGGLPHGGRIKLYNLPICRFEGLDVPLERQESRLRTFREHHLELGGGRYQATAQHVRMPACDGCPEACPGIRLEHLPQDAMADGILADAASFAAQSGAPDLLLTCTDLLEEPALARVLDGVRALAPARLRVTWGGVARVGFDAFLRAARTARVDEVPLILQPPALRQPDGNQVLPGNLDDLEAHLGAFGADDPTPALFLVLNLLFTGHHEIDAAAVDRLVAALRAAGGRRLYVAAPEIHDGNSRLRGSDLRDAIAAAVPALRARWETAGCEVRLVPMPTPDGADPARGAEAALNGLLDVDPWLPGLVRHRFAGAEMGWVMASNVVWAYPPPV